MKIHEDAAKLRAEIVAAFDGTSYPGNENIVACNRGPCLECNEIRDFFVGKHWRDVSSSELWGSLRLAEAEVLFTDQAFRFYLPAFMIAGLDVLEYQDHTSARASEVLASLTFNLGLQDRAERLKDFNLEQRRSIVSFLEFLRDSNRQQGDENINRALEFVSRVG